ncbi:MAG: hypothetical protein IPP74_12335 [Alphaproteobacteria bacterium]|nr:hypothetical protein [Alphaproteobacteria bacterium]
MSAALKLQEIKIDPLHKMKELLGCDINLTSQDIYQYNFPNYEKNDILVKDMHMKIKDYDMQTQSGNYLAEGSILLSEITSFPELDWEHMPGSILMVLITQIGKTIHNVCSDINGVGLTHVNGSIRRAVPLKHITFRFDGRIYLKMGSVWCKSKNQFLHEDRKFAEFETLSCGISRDYSSVTEKRSAQKQSIPS